MKTRTKRTICRVAGFLGLLMMLVIVDGMDQGIIPVILGGALAIACELVGAFLLWKGGVIRWPQ